MSAGSRVAALLILGLVGCRGDAPERGDVRGSTPADYPAPPAAGDALAAALVLVDGLDEEGGTVGRVLPADSATAFFRNDTLYADAGRVTRFLEPLVAVEVVDGGLRLDGRDTGIPVTPHGTAAFVPLRALAARFEAYVRAEQEPGRFATIWPPDVLCEYAAGADRRAEVFLEAAEQGLLRRCDPPIDVRVRRWSDARAGEAWAASITFRERLPDQAVASILAAHEAAPYGAYGWVAGGQLIERVPPDSASPALLQRLRDRTLAELQARICGLPEAIARRADPAPTVGATPRRGRDALHGERHLLASILAARDARARIAAGAPLVYGMDAIGPGAALARLGDDPRVGRVEPATRVEEQWVVPGPGAAGLPGLAVPPEGARLDSAELRARLRVEAARAEAECPAPAGPRRHVP